MEEVKKILQEGTLLEKKALFMFNKDSSNKEVVVKYNLWMRYFFAKYFTHHDAGFHYEMDMNNIRAYRGDVKSYVNIAFRGAAKTARTKLFIGFVVANDSDHSRRFFRILSADSSNSKQISTDIYNMLVQKRVANMYPEVFAKTSAKREETMKSFTTSTGVKVSSDTVGTDQRGALQDEARPDFVWYEDFENRKTLYSSRTTAFIWGNMEEARTGLSQDGVSVYTCNYVSETGNVHRLVKKKSDVNVVMIVPIIESGVPTWGRYTVGEIAQMKIDDDDFEGERMCCPSASKDILFDREVLNRMVVREPIKESAGFKIYKAFDASHRYGSGHDVAGGVGLDSSTSVFIDFETVPCRVVATFSDNMIKPEIFGDEVYRQQSMYGFCIAAVERNYGTEAILKLKQLGAKLFAAEPKDTKIPTGKIEQPKDYGWHTNSATKPKMIFALMKAVEDGLLELSDPGLIAECKEYSRNDLIETVKDPRLTTRHFDLLIAAAIAWQMNSFSYKPDLSSEKFDFKFSESGQFLGIQ